ILRGLTPYRDFFDHKPPLIYFLNAAGLLLGHWGLWIIDTLLVLWASLMLFKLGRQRRLSFPWLLPLFFNLFLRDHLLCQGIGMTREYTAILLLMAFCVTMGEYRRRFLILGLISGLTFFMQQDQVLPLLPFVIVALFNERPSPFIRHLLWLAAGIVAITIPLLVYFAARHALADAWNDAFLFNFTWYTTGRQTLTEHFKAIKNGLDVVNAGMAVLTALILGIGALFLKNRKKTWLIACLISVLLSLSAEYLSGRMPIGGQSFYYYFLPLSASLCALLFTVFAFTEDPSVQTRTSQQLYGFLLCCALGYTALQYAAGQFHRRSNFVKDSPEMKFLRQHPPKDFQLFVFGDANYDYAYNEFRILSPSKWIYHHFWFWYDRWDADLSKLRSITDDLQDLHTTFILDMSRPGLFRNAAHYNYWHTFLTTYYQPVQLPGVTSPTLWQLKYAPPLSGQ
ncbi:MAG TPA: hypothetical protein VGM31_05125, partial [Puia sp.]